jgi:hypothetical protein
MFGCVCDRYSDQHIFAVFNGLPPDLFYLVAFLHLSRDSSYILYIPQPFYLQCRTHHPGLYQAGMDMCLRLNLAELLVDCLLRDLKVGNKLHVIQYMCLFATNVTWIINTLSLAFSSVSTWLPTPSSLRVVIG